MGNFIGMVYGTLQSKGIDTSKMSTKEAIAKFNELQQSNSKKDTQNQPADNIPNNKNIEDGKEYENEDYLWKFSDYEEVGVQNDAKLKGEELSTFNKTLDGYFSKFKDLPKFNFITIDDLSSSEVGGYVKEYLLEGKLNTDLYINVGMIKNLKYDTDGYVSNVACRVENLSQRIKIILDHEMMHKILNYKIGNKSINMDYYRMKQFSNKQKELRDKMIKVWDRALDDGEADKISFYASSSSDELIAEAYSARENGIQIPNYISSLIDEILEFEEEE